VAQAVGDKKGITRYGHAYVPLDEALSRVVVDFSGRPGLHMHVPFKAGMIGGFDTQLTYEFFQGFVNHALVTLHIDNLQGRQRAPPVRDRVQGLCARAAHGADARPALGRRDPVHQGLAVSVVRTRRSGRWPRPGRARAPMALSARRGLSHGAPSRWSTTAWATCARCRRR
jgi:hypothetical protein